MPSVHSSSNETSEQKVPLRADVEENMEPSIRFKEWKSWKIEPLFTGVMAALGSVMIVSIIVLAILSNKNDGFATIVQHDHSINHSLFAIYAFDKGLLWTSLPSLIVTLYNLAWGLIASAAQDRQPFIELGREKNVMATRSIALDYRTVFPGWSCIVALKNGHWLVSGLMATGLPMALMAAATAHLLFLKPVVVQENMEVDVITQFNGSLLTLQTDLRKVLDLVLVTQVYGANSPAWTDGQYAFPSLSLPSESNTNLTVETEGVAGYLICTDLSSSGSNATLEDQTLAVGAEDRGCRIDESILISSEISIYMKTFSEINCSPQYGRSRFGLISGVYSADSPTLLANFSFISCIPQYWRVPGNLSLLGSTSGSPSISSFSRNDSGAVQLGSNLTTRDIFEDGLSLDVAIDATNTMATTEFGRLVYQSAQKRNPASPLGADALRESMTTLFTSAFAMLSNAVLFAPIEGAKPTISLIESRTVQRLSTYLPIASVVCVVISFSVVCSIAVLFYSLAHNSVLLEEPSGVLSYADMLLDSNVGDYVKRVRSHPKYDGRLIRKAKESYGLKGVSCLAETSQMNSKITIEAGEKEKWITSVR